ncbi:hypothetical protein GGR53DRAFT_531642 [Hypoxylon sp. FL1150]|nr:hypothetical protein GGR53DRAFT_531642 [Hypoxylon sp. FL1150]
MIHHFCSHSYVSSTTYENILRTLLLQLIRKDGDLVAKVYRESVMGKQSPSIQALERLFQTLLISASNDSQQKEHIWIVIDGFNECDAQRQASVVNLVSLITSNSVSSSNTVCKILISSRPSGILQTSLRRKLILSFAEEKQPLELAIQRYTSQRLRVMDEKFRQLAVEPSEIDNIEQCITKKSDGMFLYARIVLDYLANNIFFSGAEIKASVDELPEKLSDFYRRILLQTLAHLDSRSVDRVRSMFEWIAFARRPLRKVEFLSAMAFGAGNPNVDKLAPQYILNVCGALVEEKTDTTLAFIHISVKE